MSNQVRDEIISALANGNFVSGENLGQSLGISRAAVSKHIKALNLMGLDIFRVTGKGYKLPSPITLLSGEKIRSLIQAQSHPDLEVHNTIDSTNSYLLSKLSEKLSPGHTCIAEYQSAGRGRRGKQWISPFGSHIYLSMYWRLDKGMQAAMGLSLVAGLAICDLLKDEYGVDAQVKWPNDIYIKGKKVAGILVELEGHSYDTCHSIIGVGLNVTMPKDMGKQIDQPWTDLSSHLMQPIDRNQLTAKLFDHLWLKLGEHRDHGLESLITHWQDKDYFFGQQVMIVAGDNKKVGICRGINSQGALLLEIDQKIEPIYGGEISLRSAL